MMNRLVLLFLVFTTSQNWAQELRILESNDTLQRPKYQQFIYLSSSTPINEALYVAKIKATGSLKNISSLYERIQVKAQDLGANAFQFVAFSASNASIAELTLAVYQASDSLLEFNFEQLPKNKVFMLGSDNLLDTKVQTYKFQQQKRSIAAGTYHVYDLNQHEVIRLNKGGFTGMTLFFNKQAEGNSHYLDCSGIGLAGAVYNPYGGLGVSITTGSIHRVEPNLALLLLDIFVEKN
jgi:hypothetical protein